MFRLKKKLKKVKEKTVWPSLHNHLREWQEKRTVCGVTMGYLWGDQLKPGLRSEKSNVTQSEET